MDCGNGSLLTILPISPRVSGRGIWAVEGWHEDVGCGACKTVCWMGKQCPAGTPCCRQGFVEKTASYCDPKWSGKPSGHMADSSETIAPPVTRPCQSPPDPSAWSKIHRCSWLLVGCFLPYFSRRWSTDLRILHLLAWEISSLALPSNTKVR